MMPDCSPCGTLPAGVMVLLLAGMAALSGCGRAPAPAELESPAAPGASLPRLSVDPAGTPWLSWVEPAEDGHRLRLARFEGPGWGTASTVAAGTDWFINWADFPSVVHFGDQRMAAHWLRKVEGGSYAYHVQMAVSSDGGRNWSPPAAPHADRSATEHGFVSLFASSGGAGAVWLDGRNTAAADVPAGHDPDAHGHGHGVMTLRAGGLDWDGRRLPEFELDDMTCDCCPTAVAAVPGGVVVLYRNRSPAEIRDIYAVSLDPTGWSAPAPVAADGWEMPACPVNGPAVAARGKQVAAAWFTAADGRPRVQAAFSRDGGRSWGAPIEVADGAVLGRVAIMMPDPETAVVSWLEQSRTRADIRFRRVTPDGRTGAAHRLATTVAARSSGFPQMALAGDRLLFAWTATGEPSSIRIATAPLP
jgi:hypothetical protein